MAVKTDVLRRFLKAFKPDGLLSMVAIPPKGGKTFGRTFEVDSLDADLHDIDIYEDAVAWVVDQNEVRKRNVYFTINPLLAPVNKKPSKTDISSGEYVFRDIDPTGEGSYEEQRTDLLNGKLTKILNQEKPNFIIDSGHGLQIMHLLAEPEQDQTRYEAANKAYTKKMGGDSVHNIDRLFRAVGTDNYPSEKKIRDYGYPDKPVPTKLIHIDQTRSRPIEFFEKMIKKETTKEVAKPAETGVSETAFDERSFDDLRQTDGADVGSGDRSKHTMSLLSKMVLKGWDDERIEDDARSMPWGERYAARGWVSFKHDLERAHKFTIYVKKQQELKKAENRNDPDTLAGRYLFVDGQGTGKFYDTKADQLIAPQALNQRWREEGYIGGKDNLPLANVAFPTEGGQTVEAVTWTPCDDKVVTLGAKVCANRYRPAGVDADQFGTVLDEDVKMWLDVVKRICPVKSQREHLLDWMAFTVQFPAAKINHQVVIGGVPGTGKDSMLNPMRLGVGIHNTAEITPDVAFKDFNSHLQGTKLLVIQEAMNFNRREAENKLKVLCAAPPDLLQVNVKHLAQYYVANVLSMVMFTNHTDALYISEGDRRYFCIWSEAGPMLDDQGRILHMWFSANNNENLNRCAVWLMQRDVSHFDRGMMPPMTEWKKEIIEASTDSFIAHLRSMFDASEGEFYRGIVTVADFRNDVKELRLHRSDNAIGKALLSVGCIRVSAAFRNEKRASVRKTFYLMPWFHEKFKDLNGKELNGKYNDDFED